jgi:hypothetical protein
MEVLESANLGTVTDSDIHTETDEGGRVNCQSGREI